MANRRRVREWVLFVDESGRFDGHEASCATALLLEERDGPDLAVALREGIRRLAPTVPYPPHASVLNLPVSHLAFWLGAEPAARAEHWAAAELAALEGEFARLPVEPRLERLVTIAASREALDFDDAADANQALWARAPRLHARLATVCEEHRRRVVDYLEHLGAVYGTERCFAIAGWDGGEDEAGLYHDRYLASLTALFERIFALLRARPAADHEVRVRPAIRDVKVPVLGVIPMRPSDVGSCVRVAERFPLYPPSGLSDLHVRLVCHSPARYDANVHPGIVLADFAANRLKPTLEPTRHWDQVRVRARASTGLAVEAVPMSVPGAEPQPTVAALGRARDAIARAFHIDESALAAAGGNTATIPAPGWPSEQAERWIAIARRAAGGGAP